MDVENLLDLFRELEQSVNVLLGVLLLHCFLGCLFGFSDDSLLQLDGIHGCLRNARLGVFFFVGFV